MSNAARAGVNPAKAGPAIGLVIGLVVALAAGCSKSSDTAAAGPAGAAGAAGSSGQGAAGTGTGGAAPGPTGPASVQPTPLSAIPGHDAVVQDTTPKEAQRLLPPEAYIRSYLQLFGGLAPLEAQAAAKATNGGLFDSWNDYLSALGLPDYRVDVPRGTQINTLMLATFERLGVALCDRSVQHDLHGMMAPPVEQRVLFSFDAPVTLDEAGFASRFDQLHRRTLGYPAALAPDGRQARFFKLYTDTVTAHGDKMAPKAFTPSEAGWAVVCYGLVRHPEFHLY